tara:strand:- start:233 stop:685 length:453 start_codon:yes stop_codon:yes gene_type:complete
MKTIKYLQSTFLTTPPLSNCNFKIGDPVVWENDYQIKFYGYHVIGFSDESLKSGCCVHLNKKGYKLPVDHNNLLIMSLEEQVKLLNDKKRYSCMAQLLENNSDINLVAIINDHKIVFNSFFDHFTLSHDNIGVLDHNKDFDYLADQALKG